MGKKHQNMIIILSAVLSVSIASKVIDRYGWFPGIFAAMLIGALVGIIGKYIFKNK